MPMIPMIESPKYKCVDPFLLESSGKQEYHFVVFIV